ncbi:MAG: hypothetical protein KAH25_03940 [Bacteroidales bacterium]|nr:hypothetical protein [Bacteroidales bacterium]
MTPQAPGSKWTDEELKFLLESIRMGKTLDEIMKVISERAMFAILGKAYEYNYGYYHDQIDGLIHFKNGNKQISTQKADTVGKGAAKSVPKTEVNVNDFDKIIALYQEIIAPYQNIIAQLEKTKSRLWKH